MAKRRSFEFWYGWDDCDGELFFNTGDLAPDDDDRFELVTAYESLPGDPDDDVFPIFDILPRLWAQGMRTVEQDGRWHLFDAKGEGLVSGATFRELCVNIVMAEVGGHDE